MKCWKSCWRKKSKALAAIFSIILLYGSAKKGGFVLSGAVQSRAYSEMKIYSDMEDLTDPLADRIQAMIDGIEPDHPYFSIIPLLKEFVKSQRDAYALRVENAKLRLQWAVKGLEKEIEEEGGMLIIDKGGNLETRGFSGPLSERIHKEVRDKF